MPSDDVLEALAGADFLVAGESGFHTTRRWHAAMARAAIRLYATGAPWQDLRLPIATALAEVFDLDDETLVRYVDAMLAIESAELRRALREGAPGDPR